MIKYIHHTALSFIAFVVLSFNANAITITSVGTGNFTTPATWDCGCTPGAGDSVIIASPNAVSITSAINVGAIWVKSGASLTKSSAITITSTLTIDGTFTGSGVITFNGPHAYFTGSENPINVPGNYVVFGTLTIPSGTVLNSTNSSFQLQVGATLNNLGNLTLNNGTISVIAGSTWTNGANSTLRLGGNIFGTGILNFSAVGNTVNYSGSGSGTISVPNSSNYYNLTLGQGTKTLTGNVNVLGNFSVQASAAYVGGGFVMSLTGNLTDLSGSVNFTNADITFNGSTTQTITGATTVLLRNLVVSTTGAGKALLACAVSVSGDLTISSGGNLDVSASNKQLTVFGNWNNNGGTFVPRAGTVYLAPGVATTIGNTGGLETFYNLQKINPGSTTLTCNITVSGLFTMAAGTFNGASFNLATNTSWNHTGGIWNPNTGTVTLQGAAGYFMICNAGAETFNNLTINSSAGGITLLNPINVTGNLTITKGYLDVKSGSNYAINVGGNVVLNGQLKAQNGTFTMNGSAAQTMDASVATTFYNFTSSNAAGVTINSGTYTLSNCLTSSSGTLSTAGATSFTLPSSAASTAYIGTGAGSFGGTFIIQRYITARTAQWQDLTAPVSNTTVGDWDNEMYMSGVNGPDGYAGTLRSVQTWNEPSGAYVSVTSDQTALAPCVGYDIYMGDNLASWSAKFIDSRGTPNSGNQTIGLSYTGASGDPGDNLIGNPYASHIIWNNSLGTNVQPTIYIAQNGAYVAYGNGTDVPPHQGFIAYANSGGGSVTFTEACKAANTSSSWGRIGVQPFDFSMKISNPEQPEFYQENFLNFNDNASLGFDVELDHRFITSPETKAPSLCMVAADGKRLTRNAFPASSNETVAIPVKMTAGIDGIFHFDTYGANTMSDYSCVLLEDLFTHKVIDLKQDPSYSFSAKTTDSPDRFILHLSRKNEACERILTSVKPADAFFTDNQVVIYSNNGSALIKFDLDQASKAIVSVYDLEGRSIVKEMNIDVFRETISLNLPEASGLYLVNVNLGGNHVVTKKIFVQQ